MRNLSGSILVVGPTPAVQRRIVLDELVRNRVNRAAEVEVLASGKGLNCARAVLRLGAETDLLLFLGGAPGDWFRAVALAEGIRVHAVMIPAPTRTCITLIESGSGTETEIVENAAPVGAGDAEGFLRLFAALVPKASVVVFTGTLPQEMPVDAYARMVRTAADYGASAIVDAQGASLLAAAEAAPLLVKPNTHELAAATGLDCSSRAGLRKAVARLLGLGARYVLVTDGQNPAVLGSCEGFLEIQPPTVPPGNSIGSGDSVAAGVAVALREGKSLADAIRFGIACGSANASGAGYGRIDPGLARGLVSGIRTASF